MRFLNRLFLTKVTLAFSLFEEPRLYEDDKRHYDKR